MLSRAVVPTPGLFVPSTNDAISAFPRGLFSSMVERNSNIIGNRASIFSLSASANPSPPKLPRLTDEEQSELLFAAVETRRIRNLESEMMMAAPTTTTISDSGNFRLELAKAAGYGTDVDALEAAIENGHAARETLVTRNMGLVHYSVDDIIGKNNPGGGYSGKGSYRSKQPKGGRRSSMLKSLNREDLVQEGAIGLAKAVDRFNPGIGGKLSTYAVYWIRAAVFRCIAQCDEPVRVPEHVWASVRKISKAAHRLGIELDSSNGDGSSVMNAADAKRLAEEAGLTDRQFAEALKVRKRRNQGTLSFESWMQQGKSIETDIWTSLSDSAPSLSAENDQLHNTLSRFLGPRELEAICWRYGLSQEEMEPSHKSRPAIGSKRNYLAEAERELFGNQEQQSQRQRRQQQQQPREPKQPLDIPVGGKWGEAMSFKEVGKNMEISAEYGRKLCHRALEKLRKAANDGRLEPALLCMS